MNSLQGRRLSKQHPSGEGGELPGGAMAATLFLEGTPDMQRLLWRGKDHRVLQSRRSWPCFLCGVEARGKDSSQKSFGTHSRWPRLLCPAPTERCSDQRTVAESTVLGVKKLAALTLYIVGHFLRTCAVSMEEPRIAGLLAREAACRVPLTASAELGLPGV